MKKRSSESTDKSPQSPQVTLSALKEDPMLLYKIKVLLYDLRNVAIDRSSENRTLNTTNELYLSAPYFTHSQAELIKGATIVESNAPEDLDQIDDVEATESSAAVTEVKSIEQAIKDQLATFFEKRRASGDARPCGPHDMAPVYESVFGIHRKELLDEKFLSRVRRSGLCGLEETRQKACNEGKKGKKSR